MTREPEDKATRFGKVAVVGLGYIGLPTATFIASNGLTVIGVDANPSVVERVNRGEAPFSEPDFGSMLAAVVADRSLSAQVEMPPAEAYIVAVPTPMRPDHSIDTQYIQSASRDIAGQLRGGELIVLESTSPPGTTEELAECVLRERPDLTSNEGHSNSIYFAHAPERVLPGRIVVEMASNDRVIGGLSPRGGELARDLYQVFTQGSIHLTDARTAEMVKLTENSFRDVNIAFANEISVICDSLGIDVWELIELANHHPRVNILQPGPGVGGHCIAVDPWFIVAAAPKEAKLIRQARRVNDAKPSHVINKVLQAAASLHKPRIAVLGITFKPDVDDLRESPSNGIVEAIARAIPGASVDVVEPNIAELPCNLQGLPNVSQQDVDTAVDDAEVVVLLVDHFSFKEIGPERLEGKIVIDTRGVWR